MIPVSAPLRLRERLRAAADGPRPVVHRGPQAVYVDLDGHVAGVVSAGATRVPCAAWSSARDLPAVGITGEHAELRSGRLLIDGRELRVARLTDPRVRPDARLRPSSHRFTPELLARLLGRGEGLTPYADDVVCGWLVARHAAGAPDAEVSNAVRTLAHRTTPLSATLLDCAARGESFPELTDWLRARSGADEPVARAALIAVGASSGTGMLAGAELALEPPGPLEPPTAEPVHEWSVA
ncbi:DUF2877 domain-containing protein [Nocardioides alcanivorans]|uniref:DUF2877 domain-containing protein n=1 Tax=Nocardioides alcanivorans TaxID=2897352 RepID=UPI001F467C59|nr:DUF2877 domain-containing protein [Nocardioides alcanivorans]